MKIAVMPGDFAGKEVVAEGLKVLKVAAEKFGFNTRRPTILSAPNII